MFVQKHGVLLLVYQAKFIKLLLHVFKTSGGLIFSLFSYFCNTKRVCSNQPRGCFLVYSVTFVIQNMAVQNKREAAFVIQKMYVQNKQEECFYYKFYKNFSQRYFLNSCSLVYLANYIKLFYKTADYCFLVYSST